MRLVDVAELTQGELCKGTPELEITGVASVTEAVPGDITFFYNPRYLSALRSCKAAAVLVPRDFLEDVPAALIKVDSPSAAFAAVVQHFAPPPIVFDKGVHPTAIIGKGVELGPDVSVQAYVVIEAGARIGARTIIGAYSYIGHESRLGDDCFLHARVTVQDRCLIGNRVILHPGSVIGADGFGYESVNKKYVKIPQTGIVQIDDDVEVGANTTIDRARFGKTWIQEGAKLDNLVMIGHNVTIGAHSILCANVGVSGSSKIGAYTTLAGQAGVVGHVEIADGIIVAAQAGVTKSLSNKGIYVGSPAEPMESFKKKMAYLSRISKLHERVKALEPKK
ncbi:MAG: UDP-3-O-(3-hydroxymyristoyl)glucosamine N-acyltransferase [Chthoniobacterales bacterium]